MLRFSGRTLLLTVSVSSSSSYVPLLLMLLTLSYSIDFQIYISSPDIVLELWSPLSTAKPAFPPGCPVCSLMDTSCFLSTCWLAPPSLPESPKLEAWILSLILFSDPQCPTSRQIILILAPEDLSIHSFLFPSTAIALIQVLSFSPELLHLAPGLALSPDLPPHCC